MTYQEEIDLHRSISAELLDTPEQFVHGRRSDGSLNTIAGAFPQIHLYPTRRTMSVYPEERTTHPTLIGFWMQDSPDTTPEQREALIAQMDTLARAYKDKLVERRVSVTSFDLEPQYRQHAGTVSGIALQFTFTAGETC